MSGAGERHAVVVGGERVGGRRGERRRGAPVEFQGAIPEHDRERPEPQRNSAPTRTVSAVTNRPHAAEIPAGNQRDATNGPTTPTKHKRATARDVARRDRARHSAAHRGHSVPIMRDDYHTAAVGAPAGAIGMDGEAWRKHGRRVRAKEPAGLPQAVSRPEALDAVLVALMGALGKVPAGDRRAAETFAAEGYLAEHVERGGTEAAE